MKTPIGIEVFSGFGMSYPEYEVVTPQSLKHFTLRTLTVGEEEILKGSMLTPSTIAQHIAEVLWKCIIKKPDDIKTFDDFLNKTTLRDRDALIIGLHLVTYGDIENYAVTCPSCNASNNIKIDVAKSMVFDVWPNEQEDFVSRRVTVPLSVFKGVSAVIKPPTMAEEIAVNKKTQHMSEQMGRVMMELLMIDKFIVEPTEKNPKGDKIEDRNNILSAYNSLPSKDKSLIAKRFREEFNKYQIVVKTKIFCQNCGKEIEVNVDLTQQFFRSLYE